ARALAGDRAGRLYQCRQIHLVQPDDAVLGDGRESAVRDPRSDHAQRTDPPPFAAGRTLSPPWAFFPNLPPELVAAFRATLEEVAAADLILHVRDIAHPDSDAQAADVEEVLTSLGL